MNRFVSCVAGLLLAFGVAASPAAAQEVKPAEK